MVPDLKKVSLFGFIETEINACEMEARASKVLCQGNGKESE